MIEKVTGYKVGQSMFVNIEEAQLAELEEILAETNTPLAAAKAIVAAWDKVIDILKMAPKNKPAAKTYTAKEFQSASIESGVPVKILRQRCTTGGRSLNDAKSLPYTARPRKTTVAA
jgi:hypothetical protein